MRDIPRELLVRPVDVADAHTIAAWAYDGPWSVYDLADDSAALSTDHGFRIVADAADRAVVGFYCVGAEARVPGMTASIGVVDIGLGMDPDLVGRAFGTTFGKFVLDQVRRTYPHDTLRAVVQTWNLRALQLTRRLGFAESATHISQSHGVAVEYAVVTADPAPT